MSALERHVHLRSHWGSTLVALIPIIRFLFYSPDATIYLNRLICSVNFEKLFSFSGLHVPFCKVGAIKQECLNSFRVTIKRFNVGISLVIQQLRLCTSSAGCVGSIPVWGTRSHMMHGAAKKVNK